MNQIKKVAVIIPFYKDSLTANEEISLLQCKKVLANYPIIAIKPNHLSLPVFSQKLQFTETINFDDKYFKSINGYNALLVSEDFYGRFLGYEYILIYQTDAFVFSDELNYWCNTGYDYIGAPWLQMKKYGKVKSFFYNYLYKIYFYLNIKKLGLPNSKQFTNKIGNGGFSLRKVSTFFILSKRFKHKAEKYFINGECFLNEDVFWCIELTRRKKYLKIPNLKTGLLFALENRPEIGINRNNGKLPFGCHAWENYLDFWRTIFKELGYEI